MYHGWRVDAEIGARRRYLVEDTFTKDSKR